MSDIVELLRSEPHRVSPGLALEAASEIERLRVSIRRGISCIKRFTPYVQWDGIDWEEQQTNVALTLELMNESLGGTNGN